MNLLKSNHAVRTSSVAVAAEDQVSSELAGEAVILSLRTGMYYGLDPVGARIWALLASPTSIADIRDTIVGEYDVDVDRCERDVLTFVRQLLAQDLIEVGDGTPP
ncbi:MAG: PqqD family protein [Chloroflexi bacterium]|nr:MAG: PqqD family protein [Chloroflexota bacterium]